jgi:putative transposase
MRYPDGGGLTAAGRARREKVRLSAAAMFGYDMDPVQVAHELRVSTKSAYQWRRRWRAGLQGRGRRGVSAVCGTAGQAARRAGCGPGGLGWEEHQRWTLERVTRLIGRLFHVRCTCGTPRSCCTGSGSPRRSRRTRRPSAMRPRSPPGGTRPGSGFEASGGDPGRTCAPGDEAGQALRPPKART